MIFILLALGQGKRGVRLPSPPAYPLRGRTKFSLLPLSSFFFIILRFIRFSVQEIEFSPTSKFWIDGLQRIADATPCWLTAILISSSKRVLLVRERTPIDYCSDVSIYRRSMGFIPHFDWLTFTLSSCDSGIRSKYR